MDAKSNEITAMPKLLEMLSLKGMVITADAMHCQRDTAARIVAGGGNYAPPLQGVITPRSGNIFAEKPEKS
ncbi:MAG: transposase [Gammaproteobacteria bacterium]|nr:transposase [Gammaproteobacteria bacterium]